MLVLSGWVTVVLGEVAIVVSCTVLENVVACSVGCKVVPDVVVSRGVVVTAPVVCAAVDTCVDEEPLLVVPASQV